MYFLKEPRNSVNFQEKPEVDSAGDNNPAKSTTDKDPWSLELFDDGPPVPADTGLSNASVIITNQGIHLIQQKKPTITEILNKPKRTKIPHVLQRSLSQPHFANSVAQIHKGTILSLGRKLSLNYSRSSLIDVETYESTFYLYSVLWLCIIMMFWKNVMLLPLLPIPILFYVIKHLGIYLGLWSYLYEKFKSIFDSVASWCQERHDALVPVPIRGIYRVIHKANSILKNGIKDSIDTVASCVVIFGLIVFLICASVFIAVQVSIE